MKKFLVTYRGKDGQQETLLIEAADRQAVFTQLAERGISPIRVEEYNGKTKPRKVSPRGGAKSSKAFKFIVASLAAAIVAVVVVFAVTHFLAKEPPAEPETPAVAKPSQITEATPSPASTYEEVALKPPPKDDRIIGKRGIPIETYGHKTYRDERGVLRYEGGLRVYDPNRPSRKLDIKKGAPDIFTHHSENAIASIIMHEAGDLIVGDLEYGDDFIEDFNASLAENIEYSEDDTDYVRHVKDAVAEVKKELHEMMNRGEDIAQAMNDARNDLRNLFMYRQEIMSMVSETADSDDAADDEVRDIIEAANIMFREKGIKEIEPNEFIRMSIILEKERARQNGEQLEETEE